MIDLLIQKMSGAEKRYHFLMSKAFKKNPEHLRLFKFIQKQKNWNDTMFADFERGYSGNEAALKKRYLKEMILDSLRGFHKKRTVGRIIMNHIQDAELFYHKLLFKECLKTLEKANTLAEKHERFGLHIEIIGWKRRLIGSTLEKYAISESDLDTEEAIIHKKNDMELKSRKMQATIFEYKKKYGFLDKKHHNELKNLLPETLSFNSESINSKRAEFYVLWANSLYHSMLAEHESSYKNTSLITLKFADVVDPEDHFYGMLEHLTSCIYTHRYHEVIRRILELEKSIESEHFADNIAINERFFYYKFNYLLIAYAALSQESKLKAHITHILRELAIKKDKLSEPMLFVLKGTMAEVYFIMGDYVESKNYCKEILNFTKHAVRKDIIDNFKVFYLFILLELNEFDLLQSEARSNIKYFKQNPSIYKIPLEISRLFLKHEEGKKGKTIELAGNLMSLFGEKFAFNDNQKYFDDLFLYLWAKSKLSGKSSFDEFTEWRAKEGTSLSL